MAKYIEEFKLSIIKHMKAIKFINIWHLRAYKFLAYLGRTTLIFASTAVISTIMKAEEAFFLKDLLVIGLIIITLFLAFFPGHILFKRKFPDHDGVEIILRAKKIKNKRERIQVLEQAVQLAKVSPNEKLWMLRNISELYKEVGEESKVVEYYTEIEKKTQEILKEKDIPIDIKIEAAGQLAILSFEQKDFEKATCYYDEILKYDLEGNRVFFEKEILKSMLETYLLNHQKQRAIQIYDSLLRQKRCKRNKEMERVLY